MYFASLLLLFFYFIAMIFFFYSHSVASLPIVNTTLNTIDYQFLLITLNALIEITRKKNIENDRKIIVFECSVKNRQIFFFLRCEKNYSLYQHRTIRHGH